MRGKVANRYQPRPWQGDPCHPALGQSASTTCYLEDHAADDLMRDLRSKGYDPDNGGELLKRDTDSFSANNDRYFSVPDVREEEHVGHRSARQSLSEDRDTMYYLVSGEEDSYTDFTGTQTSTRSSSMETSYVSGSIEDTRYTDSFTHATTTDENEEDGLIRQPTDYRTSFTIDRSEYTGRTPMTQRATQGTLRVVAPERKPVQNYPSRSENYHPSTTRRAGASPPKQRKSKHPSAISEPSEESFFTDIPDNEFSKLMENSFGKESSKNAYSRIAELRRKKKKVKELLQKSHDAQAKVNEITQRRSNEAVTPDNAQPSSRASPRHFFPDDKDDDNDDEVALRKDNYASSSLPSIDEDDEPAIPPPPPVSSKSKKSNPSAKPKPLTGPQEPIKTQAEEPLSPTLRISNRQAVAFPDGSPKAGISKGKVNSADNVPTTTTTTKHFNGPNIGSVKDPRVRSPQKSLDGFIEIGSKNQRKNSSTLSLAGTSRKPSPTPVGNAAKSSAAGPMSRDSRLSHRNIDSKPDASMGGSHKSVSTPDSRLSHRNMDSLPDAPVDKSRNSGSREEKRKGLWSRFASTSKPSSTVKVKRKPEKTTLVDKTAPSSPNIFPKASPNRSSTRAPKMSPPVKSNTNNGIGLVSREELFKELQEEGLTTRQRRWSHADNYGSMLGHVITPREGKVDVETEPLTMDGDWSVVSRESECMTDGQSVDSTANEHYSKGFSKAASKAAFMKRFRNKHKNTLPPPSASKKNIEAGNSNDPTVTKSDKEEKVEMVQASRPNPLLPPNEKSLQPGEFEVLKMGRAGKRIEGDIAPPSLQASRGSPAPSTASRQASTTNDTENAGVETILNLDRTSNRGSQCKGLRVDTLVTESVAENEPWLNRDYKGEGITPKGRSLLPKKSISGLMKHLYSPTNIGANSAKNRDASPNTTIAGIKAQIGSTSRNAMDQVRKLSPRNRTKTEKVKTRAMATSTPNHEPRARLTRRRANPGGQRVPLFRSAATEGSSSQNCDEPDEYLDLSEYDSYAHSMASSCTGQVEDSKANSTDTSCDVRPSEDASTEPPKEPSYGQSNALPNRPAPATKATKPTQPLEQEKDETLNAAPASSAPGRVERENRKLNFRRKMREASKTKSKQETTVVEAVEPKSASTATSVVSSVSSIPSIARGTSNTDNNTNGSRGTPSYRTGAASSPEPASELASSSVVDSVPRDPDDGNRGQRDGPQQEECCASEASATTHEAVGEARQSESAAEQAPRLLMQDFYSRTLKPNNHREPANAMVAGETVSSARSKSAAATQRTSPAPQTDNTCTPVEFMHRTEGIQDEDNRKEVRFSEDIALVHEFNAPSMSITVDGSRASPSLPETSKVGISSSGSSCSSSTPVAKPKKRGLFSFIRRNNQKREERMEEDSDDQDSILSSESEGSQESVDNESLTPRNSPLSSPGSSRAPTQSFTGNTSPMSGEEEGIELIARRSKTTGRNAVLIAKSDRSVRDSPPPQDRTHKARSRRRTPRENAGVKRILGKKPVRKGRRSPLMAFRNLFKSMGATHKMKSSGKRLKHQAERNKTATKGRNSSPNTIATEDSGYTSGSAANNSVPTPQQEEPRPIARKQYSTVKSPVSIRKEQQDELPTRIPDTIMRNELDLLSTSVATDAAEPGSSVASDGRSAESSLRMDVTTEPSHVPTPTPDSGGDFLSWLLPGIFGPIPTNTPSTPSRPSTDGLHAHADELSSAAESSCASSRMIGDNQWQDILTAVETLAVQYRQAQNIEDDTEMSISEATIRSVNAAIARFKEHAKTLGVSEKQLMEAVRDDDRSLHSNKNSEASRRREKSQSDKFLQMFEYFFLPSGPGSSLQESVDSTTAHYHGK